MIKVSNPLRALSATRIVLSILALGWSAGAAARPVFADTSIVVTSPASSVSVNTGDAGTTANVTGGSGASINASTNAAGSTGSVTGGASSVKATGPGSAGAASAAATPTPSKGGSQSSTQSSRKDACGNRYIPFLAGAQWQYRVTAEDDEEAEYTRAIVSVNSNRANVQDTFITPADEPKRADQWQCRNGAVIASALSAWGSVGVAGVSVGAATRSDGVTLPADPKPGEKWSQDSRYGGSTQAAGQNIGGDVRVKETCQAVKTESVSVPAGKFNALRVECDQQITAQGGAMGIGTGNTSVSTKRTDWYAAGVGLVKSQSEGSETVLVRYRLP